MNRRVERSALLLRDQFATQRGRAVSTQGALRALSFAELVVIALLIAGIWQAENSGKSVLTLEVLRFASPTALGRLIHSDEPNVFRCVCIDSARSLPEVQASANKPGTITGTETNEKFAR